MLKDWKTTFRQADADLWHVCPEDMQACEQAILLVNVC